MLEVFNENELRVIGCLMEKALTTPEQYPLSLNALTNACNQKSSRDPVMSLDQGTVERTLRGLEERNWVGVEENFRRGVKKYVHHFYSSSRNIYKLDPAQYAVICLLLLRGRQTPGELRARSGRLHSFEDNSAVVTALNSLMGDDREDFVVKLPRTPGRKDSEYMHLFAGPIAAEKHSHQEKTIAKTVESVRSDQKESIQERLSALEKEVADIKNQLGLDKNL